MSTATYTVENWKKSFEPICFLFALLLYLFINSYKYKTSFKNQSILWEWLLFEHYFLWPTAFMKTQGHYLKEEGYSISFLQAQ